MLHIPAHKERIIRTRLREEGGIRKGHEANIQLNKRAYIKIQRVIKQAIRTAV
jgi:hypothetical protein